MHRLAVALSVLVVVIAASDVAEPPGQVYWKKILPNTPMPHSIKILLKQAGDIYHEQGGTKMLKDSATARWKYRKQGGTDQMLKDSVTALWKYRKQGGGELLKDSVTAPWEYRTQGGAELLKDSVTPRWKYRKQGGAEMLKDSVTPRWKYRKQGGAEMLKDSVTAPWEYRKQGGGEMLKDSVTAPWEYRTQGGAELLKDSVTPSWKYRKQGGGEMLKDSATALWKYREQSETKMLKDSATARWKYRTVDNGAKTHHDPDTAIFFVGKDLQPGTRMTLHFPDPSISRAPFISRSEASLLPFTPSMLPEILDRFSIQPNSNDAESVRYTLTECEEPALEGEVKHCPTSLESMIDFSTATLGSRDVLALSTSVDRENSPKQQYEITSVRAQEEMSGYSSVVCHPASYVYAVFSCHATEEAKAYQVSLVGKDGTRVEAMATCHTDTSKWDPAFFAFQTLGVKPGTVPICHFLMQDLVLWTPSFK